VLAGVWLRDSVTQVSAEVRESVAHYRRVRDGALYKFTFGSPFTYFTCSVSRGNDSPRMIFLFTENAP